MSGELQPAGYGIQSGSLPSATELADVVDIALAADDD